MHCILCKNNDVLAFHANITSHGSPKYKYIFNISSSARRCHILQTTVPLPTDYLLVRVSIGLLKTKYEKKGNDRNEEAADRESGIRLKNIHDKEIEIFDKIKPIVQALLGICCPHK